MALPKNVSEWPLEGLADNWSDWVSFTEALAIAPRLPGVYVARQGVHSTIVYVGMAGERNGGGRPQGIRGRLAVYTTGKGLASGLGEAAFDRALADPEWLTARLAEVKAGRPMRAKAWGRAALDRADLYLRWSVTADKASARVLENGCLGLLGDIPLWNRAR